MSKGGNLSLKFILQVVDQASGPIGKVKGQLDTLTGSAGKVGSSTNAASQGVGNLGKTSGTAAGQVGNLSKQVVTSNSNLQSGVAPLQNLSKGYTLAGTGAQGAITPTRGLGTEVGRSSPLFNAASKSVSGFGTANTGIQGGLTRSNLLMGNMAVESGNAAGGMDNLGKSTDSTASKAAKTTQSLRGMIIPMVGLASAGIEAIGMFQTWQATTEKVNMAQEKLNIAIELYGKDSEEARQATSELQDAQRGSNFIMRSMIQSFSDMGIFIALLVNQFGKMGGITSTLGGLFDRLRGRTAAVQTSFVQVGAEMQSMPAKANGVRGAFSRLGSTLRGSALALGGIGLALVGVTAALAIISTNTFGARTALDDFGASVGKAAPALNPLLEGIRDVGEALGIVEPNGRTAAQAFAELEQQTVKNTAKQDEFNFVFDAGINALTGAPGPIQTFINALGQIPGAIAEAFGNFAQEVDTRILQPLRELDVIGAISNAVSGLASWIGTNIIDPFVAGFEAIVAGAVTVATGIWEGITSLPGTIASWIGTDILDPFLTGFQSIITAAQTVAGDIWTGITSLPGVIASWFGTNVLQPLLTGFMSIVGGSETVGPDVFAGITAFPEAIASWFSTNVLQPILTAFTNITAGAVGVGQKIWAGITGGLTGVANWVNQNIVDPFIQGFNNIIDGAEEVAKRLESTLLGKALKGDLAPKEGEPTTGLGQFLPQASQAAQQPRITQVADFNAGQGSLQQLFNPQAAQRTQDNMSGIEKSALKLNQAFVGISDSERRTGEQAKLMFDLMQIGALGSGKEVDSVQSVMNNLGVAMAGNKDAVGLAQEAWDAFNNTQGTYAQKAAAAQQILSGGTEKVKKQDSALDKLNKTNQDSARSITELGKAAADGTLTQAALTKGTNDAKLAMLNYGQEVVANGAFLSQWGGFVDSAVGRALMFQQGVNEQKKALQDSKQALAESQGALSEYNSQIASGVPQQVAYQQAIVDTGIALNDADVAIASTQGSIDAMNQALSTGRPQQQAYTQGWQEVQQEIQTAEQDIFKTMGRIDSMNAALQTGVPQTQAYARGWLSVQENMQESIIALAETRGQIEAMNDALASGLPQAIAYLEGFNSITQAMQQMEIDTARLVGEFQRMDQSLATVSENNLRVVNGFFEGARAAQDFTANIDTTTGSIIGYRTELESIANELGITLPDNINISNEALENMIGIAKSGEEAMVRMKESINEAAKAFGEQFAVKVGEELDAVGDKVDEWADQWEETFGVDVPEAWKNAGEQLGKDRTIIDAIQDQGSKLKSVGGPAFVEGARFLIDSLTSTMDDMSPQLRERALALIGVLEEAIACPGCPGAIAKVDAALAGLGDVVKTHTESTKNSVKILADDFVAKFGDMAKAVDDLIAKQPQLERFRSELQGLASVAPATVAGLQNMPDARDQAAGLAPGGKPIQVPQGVPFGTQPIAQGAISGIDQLIAKLKLVAQTLSLLGPATTQAVGQMNTAFTSVAQTWPAIFIAALTPIVQQLMLLGPATAQVVGQMNLAFTSLAQTWPVLFAAAITPMVAQLMLLGPATAQVIGMMNLAFSSLATTWPQIFASAMTPIVAQLMLLGPAVAQVVGQMNTAFATIAQTWPTIMQSALTPIVAALMLLGPATQQVVTQMITAFRTITPAVTQVATQMRTIFQQATTAVSQSVTQMASSVQSSMSQIASALQQAQSRLSSFASAFSSAMSTVRSQASSAASAVKSLQSAIDSLKSKTITITTVFVTRRVTLRHGGSFLNFQHGGSFVSDKEQRIGPAKISEFNKPELVTVTPLSNPNSTQDKSINLDMTSANRKQRKNNPISLDTGQGVNNRSTPQQLTVRGNIHATLVMPDGRRLAKQVIPFELENADAFYV